MTYHPIPIAPATQERLVLAVRTRAVETIERLAGDDPNGIETAGPLAQALAEGALLRLAAGAVPIELERGLYQGARMVTDVLLGLARSTAQDGLVPGSGFVFIRALAVLELEEPHFFEDVRAGVHLLRDALLEPTATVARRLGLSPESVVARMREGHGSMGIDPNTGAFVDLVSAGVMASARVLHEALDAAVNAVVSMIRLEASASASLTMADDRASPSLV